MYFCVHDCVNNKDHYFDVADLHGVYECAEKIWGVFGYDRNEQYFMWKNFMEYDGNTFFARDNNLVMTITKCNWRDNCGIE